MKAIEFDQIVQKRLEACKSVLCRKDKEYSSDTDRLHNFKVAGRINNETPEQALWGMYTKHLVSVMDMVNSPEGVTLDAIAEKIGDSINYHLLFEGLLMERVGKRSAKI